MSSHTVVLCSSAAFYRHVTEIAEQLSQGGIRSVVPATAKKMAKTGDFSVETHKTWYDNEADYDKKADLMRQHFDEIANGDSILVVNDEKHGVPNYIGPNVLMEMSLAFYLRKPIYIFNDLPSNSPYEEEIKGMKPVVLGGDVEKLASLISR